MKKLIFLIILTGLLGVNACKDKEKENGGLTEDPLTPEANKELLQTVAIDFVDEMALMEETETSQTLISFGKHIDESAPESGRVVNNLNKPILAFLHQKISTIQFGRSSSRVTEESLEDLFNNNKGVWEWNSSTGEWDFTKGGEVIAFEFPSEEDGSENNAVLTLRSYEGTYISNPIEDEYEGDLPVSLDLDLFVDGTKEMAYSFDIEYSAEGEPTSVETTLFVNPFELTYTLGNTETKISTGVLFTNGDKVLIDIDTEINGNFDDDVIESVDEDDDNVVNVIFDGSVSVTLLDFNMTTSIDFKDFYNQVKDLETYHDYYWDGELTEDFDENADKMESALNDYLIITTSYVSTGKKAANAEWYTTVEEDEYGIWIELGARMVFEDGSKVDIEDYFSAGFDELESEINDLINQVGDDLDADFDEIDFG